MMDYNPSYDLLIATPAYGGLVTTNYVVGMVQTFYGLQSLGISFKLFLLDNESLIQRGRDKCAAAAVKTGARKMLFVDADLGWTWGDMHSLITSMDSHDLGVIGGTYPCKTFPIQLNYNPKEADIDKYFSSSMKRGPAMHKEFGREKGPIVEVMHVPTGFMLIDVKKVLVDTLGGKVGKYSSGGQELKAYFPVSIRNGVLESEDWGFCSLCADNGIPVYLHTGVVLAHQGSMSFDCEKLPILQDV